MEVEDWDTGAAVTLALDPEKTAVENAEALYKQVGRWLVCGKPGVAAVRWLGCAQRPEMPSCLVCFCVLPALSSASVGFPHPCLPPHTSPKPL